MDIPTNFSKVSLNCNRGKIFSLLTPNVFRTYTISESFPFDGKSSGTK